MINILKSIILVSVLILILTALGAGINSLVPWSWLTSFFVIIRHFGNVMNFMWDMPTLWSLVGYTILLESFVWAFRGGMVAIHYFKSK